MLKCSNTFSQIHLTLDPLPRSKPYPFQWTETEKNIEQFTDVPPCDGTLKDSGEEITFKFELPKNYPPAISH